MNLISILLVLTGFFYSISISFIYCCFLTPKDNVRCPRISVFLITSVICIFAVIDFHFVTYGLVIFMAIALVLFKDPFSRRMAGMIIAYTTQLSTELIAVNIYNLLYFLIFKKLPVTRTTPVSQNWELLATLSLIIICGTIITAVLTKYLKTWLCHFHTSSLSLIGLPLIVTMFLYNILMEKLDTPQFYVYFIVICLLYLLCYYPIAIGFRRIHHQEKERASLEKQRALVQEQLAYSQQMEEEYRKLRKWNHDIANHIIALSYLLDNEKYQEGTAYLETLLDISKANPNKSPTAV